jgi:NitT/TauT family transport system permease protein
MRRGARLALARAGVVVGAVALLEAACRTGVINPLTIIPPSAMAASMIELLRSGSVTGDIVTTFTTVGTAFVLAVAVGTVAGVALHAVPLVRAAMNPLLASYYSVPIFVFYPLLVALLGLGTLPLIAIGFLFAMPAVVIATLIGLDRVPPVLRRVARMHRLGRFDTAVRVVLPSAAPYLFNGVKLALAYAFIGVIAGEFILSGSGLGYAIAYAYESFDNRTMYGLLLFVLLTAVVSNGLLYAWEQRLLQRRARA